MELEEINSIVKKQSLEVPFSNIPAIFEEAGEKAPENIGTNCKGHAELLSDVVPDATVIKATDAVHWAVLVNLSGELHYGDTSIGMSEIVPTSVYSESPLIGSSKLASGKLTLLSDEYDFRVVVKRPLGEGLSRWTYDRSASCSSVESGFINRTWIDFLTFLERGDKQIHIRRSTYSCLYEARHLSRSGVITSRGGMLTDHYIEMAAEAVSMSGEDLKGLFEKAVNLYHFSMLRDRVENAL